MNLEKTKLYAMGMSQASHSFNSGHYATTQQFNMSNDTTDSKKSAAKIDSQDVTIAQAKRIIVPLLKTGIVPFMWGPPGIGKSSLTKAICEENHWELIDLRLSLLNPVDLRGLPVLDKKNAQADWYPPSFLPKYNTKKTGILFLDEINLAPLNVQAAAYQLILDKQVGQYRFPPHWFIIAAGNRETDRANVYCLNAPLANRFYHLNIYPDFATWAEWARDKVRDEIRSFLVLRPVLLFKMPTETDKAFPSPRTWSFLSTLLDTYGFGTSADLSEDVKHIIIGTIGESVGSEFIMFLSSYNLKKIAVMVENYIQKGQITLPKKASERHAIITSLYKAYLDKRLIDVKWQAVFQKLTNEEKKSILIYEKEQSLDRDYAVTTHDVLEKDDTVYIDNPKGFRVQKGTAEITHSLSGYREIIIYDKLLRDRLSGVKRGQNGTMPLNFPKGSIVKAK